MAGELSRTAAVLKLLELKIAQTAAPPLILEMATRVVTTTADLLSIITASH